MMNKKNTTTALTMMAAVTAAAMSQTTAFAPVVPILSSTLTMQEIQMTPTALRYEDDKLFFAEAVPEEKSSNLSAEQREAPSKTMQATLERPKAEETTAPKSKPVTKTPIRSNTPASAATAKKGKPVVKKAKDIGLLSPLVLVAKDIMGEKELQKLRGEIITLHSNVIDSFVSTSDSPFGKAVLRRMFTLADFDGNGQIDKDEFKAWLDALGFDFLKPKQVDGMFERADADQNGTVDMDEFIESTPKALKANLKKLAKQNGKDMGLMA